MSKRHAFLVLGMARSGTSAMAGLLNIMGVDMCPRLSTPADRLNPKGFFEHHGLKMMHIRILKEIGWWNILEHGFPEHTSKHVRWLLSDIERILYTDFPGTTPFGIKDPRLALLIEPYLRIFEGRDNEPWFIVMERDRQEIKASLKKSYGFVYKYACKGTEKTLDDFMDFQDAYIYANVPKDHVISVNYKALIDDPLHVARTLTQAVPDGIFRDIDEIAQEIVGFIDPQLYRFRKENLTNV